MKTKSAKAKGRRLQDWVRETIIKYWNVAPEEVRCAIMGEKGSDIKFSGAALIERPFAFECKNQEATKNIYDWYDQAIFNAKDADPILILKRNNRTPLVVIDAFVFFKETR